MGLDMKRTIVIVGVIVLFASGIIALAVVLKKSPKVLELEVWPREGSEKEPIIQYRSADRDSWSAWTNRTDDFLKEYRVQNAGKVIKCSAETRASGGDVCDVDIKGLHPCTPENHYGYHKLSPCVFLRLTKIDEWVPSPYNSTDSLPLEMPEDLKTHISAVAATDANAVWVSCEGVTPADKEFIGPVQYIPGRGFPSYYYPFTDQPGYLSPLVAVHFERPHIGVLINVECKAWAKNMLDDQHSLVHFSLFID